MTHSQNMSETKVSEHAQKSSIFDEVKRYILEQEGKDVFGYDIYNCPKELKGQLKIGDFTK